MPRSPSSNSASDVLMIRPACFSANLETAASNAFQAVPTATQIGDVETAQQEFDGLARALLAAGVSLHVFDDLPDPPRPDAVFPNNWVSFHADGSIVIFPMLARNRRAERRLDILSALVTQGTFRVARLVDLSHYELEGRYLEGTGSLVLDRVSRVAYACVSPRTDLDVAAEFARLLGYELVTFDALDRNGLAVYHTNVMMAIGTHFAAVCLDAIHPSRRAEVRERLVATGREIIALSMAQICSFAGNMIELATRQGTKVVAMSEAARLSLTAAQRTSLEELAGPIVAAPVPTIERLGGGSVRCMIAEVHLPTLI